MRMYIHEISEDEKFSPVLDVKDCVVYKPSPLSSMLVERVKDVDGKEFVCFHSDISLLLSQQRLSRELSPIFEDMLRSSGASDLSDMYPNLTDDDIFSCIKSRYLQAPSEIQDWSRYLMAELDRLNLEMAQPSEPVDELVYGPENKNE